MLYELEKYSDEILNLRCWVAENSGVHPNKILMTALRTRPIVVSYIMRKKHCGTFLKYVKSDDGQIAASRNIVEKIINNGEVFNIGNTIYMKFVTYVYLIILMNYLFKYTLK